MSIDFQLDYQGSSFLSDTTETAVIPIDGELFDGDDLKHLSTEIMGIQYVLGLPGLRGSAIAVWGSETVLGTGSASGTTVVFAATQTLVAGQLIAGASPTSTGWRRVSTGRTGLTFTVNSSFDSAISAATITSHGTLAQRISAIDNSIALIDADATPVAYHFARDGGDTDHDIVMTAYYRDGTSESVTKRLDATFADGTGNGGMQSGDSLPTSGEVHLYPGVNTSGDLDFFATDGSAPSNPSGFVRRTANHMPLLTDSSANMRDFDHDWREDAVFLADTLALDLSVTNQDTTQTTRTAVNACANTVGFGSAVGVHASDADIQIRSTYHTDQAPNSGAAPLCHIRSAGNVAPVPIQIPLDGSRQYVTDSTNSSTTVRVQFEGYFVRLHA